MLDTVEAGMRNSLLASVVAFTFLLYVTVQDATHGQTLPSYSFQTIDVPGAGNSAAFGINGNGQIVGHYVDAGRGLLRGFLLSQGAFSLIDFPASGEVQTQAYGINQSGQIVGNYNVMFTNHGFFRDNQGYAAIEVPSAFMTQGAFGINGTGQIVGAYSDAAGGQHGFLLDQGIFTTIDFPGIINTQAYGINDTGQIVGTIYEAATSHGFLLDQGTFTAFDFPGAVSTQALGINNSAQIVGLYFDDSGRFHGFLLDDGEFSTVDVPGAFLTAARGINDQGQIVGNYLDGLGGHGFVATPPSPQVSVDLDIAFLRPVGPGFIKEPCHLPVRMNIQLGVVNSGTVDQPRIATIVAVQSGAEVYRESLFVSAPVGGDRIVWRFPTFIQNARGPIRWTATITDDDPDDDVAQVFTGILPNPVCR
jgi:uncharacterized membrane protein